MMGWVTGLQHVLAILLALFRAQSSRKSRIKLEEEIRYEIDSQALHRLGKADAARTRQRLRNLDVDGLRDPAPYQRD